MADAVADVDSRGRSGVCAVKGATKGYKSYPQILSYLLATN